MKTDVLAAIDVGTNSVHLVVAKVGVAHLEVIEREREMARLGSAAGDMKEMSAEAMDRAILALIRFRQVAEIHAAPVRVVATSAVREAGNRQVLLERARTEADLDIEVISGFEEARLIHLGALQAVPVFDRQMILCDIGGGSTELVLGKQGEVLTSRSFKLGAIRLTQRFLDEPRTTPAMVDASRRYVRATLAPFVRELHLRGHDVAVGSSGTIGAVCWMVAALREEKEGTTRPRTLNNFVVTRSEIDEVVLRLARAATVEERSELPGLDPRRADIVLGGALILEQVVQGLGIEDLTFSDYALREGVLLDTWQRLHGGSLHHLSELRRRSVLKLVDLMDEDPMHSAEVARLSLALFDVTAGHHGLGDESRELLEAGALLCNIGLYVSHAGHHKHSYYLIRNSEHLAGFTDREIELIAQIARYHRKSAPRAKHDAFAALSPGDQDQVRTLAGLLRIAVGLDRNHAGRVEKIRCRSGGEGKGPLVFEAVPRRGEDITLELYAATQRKSLLERALGRRLELVEGGS